MRLSVISSDFYEAKKNDGRVSPRSGETTCGMWSWSAPVLSILAVLSVLLFCQLYLFCVFCACLSLCHLFCLFSVSLVLSICPCVCQSASVNVCHLNGQNRQSRISSGQRMRSTLAGHSAVPRGTNVTKMNANRAI